MFDNSAALILSQLDLSEKIDQVATIVQQAKKNYLRVSHERDMLAERLAFAMDKYEMLKDKYETLLVSYNGLRDDFTWLYETAPEEMSCDQLLTQIEELLQAAARGEAWVSPHPSPSPSPSPSLILEEEEEEAPSVWDTDEEVVANIDWSDSQDEIE